MDIHAKPMSGSMHVKAFKTFGFDIFFKRPSEQFFVKQTLSQDTHRGLMGSIPMMRGRYARSGSTLGG
jgi:hypothetical protein